MVHERTYKLRLLNLNTWFSLALKRRNKLLWGCSSYHAPKSSAPESEDKGQGGLKIVLALPVKSILRKLHCTTTLRHLVPVTSQGHCCVEEWGGHYLVWRINSLHFTWQASAPHALSPTTGWLVAGQHNRRSSIESTYHEYLLKRGIEPKNIRVNFTVVSIDLYMFIETVRKNCDTVID